MLRSEKPGRITIKTPIKPPIKPNIFFRVSDSFNQIILIKEANTGEVNPIAYIWGKGILPRTDSQEKIAIKKNVLLKAYHFHRFFGILYSLFLIMYGSNRSTETMLRTNITCPGWNPISDNTLTIASLKGEQKQKIIINPIALKFELIELIIIISIKINYSNQAGTTSCCAFDK